MERNILGILKRVAPLLAVRGRDPQRSFEYLKGRPQLLYASFITVTVIFQRAIVVSKTFIMMHAAASILAFGSGVTVLHMQTLTWIAGLKNSENLFRWARALS